MFRAGYELASHFTLPVVVSQRFHTGEVECGVGAAIVLDDQGWMATAAHMLEPAFLHSQHQQELAQYQAERKKIEAGPGNESGKAKRIRRLSHGAKWLTNYSYWLGIDGWSPATVHILPEADLALCLIEGFDPAKVQNLPVFKNPADMQPGASVCRLGFPFHEIGATYDQATDRFTLDPDKLPIPRFPNEGIVTRFGENGVASDGTQLLAVETSSAGLRGQSGGPIFDTEGRVWGMQSRTMHLALGFSPVADIGGRKVVEHQFLNVGIAVHSQTIQEFGAKHGVQIATA